MPVEYEVPEGVTYGCTMCGDCCRSYHILVTDEERRRIEALDFRGKVDRLADAPRTKKSREPGSAKFHALDRVPGGACVFLGERNQCLIHEHFGEDAKPLTCRLYPYSFYPLGSKVGVNVAFSCKSVSEGLGEDVRLTQPEWTAKFFHTHGGKDARKHRLVPGREIPGDLAWEIEHTLMGWLKDRSMPFDERIRCGLAFLRLGTTGDPLAKTAAMFREAIAAGIPKQVRKMERAQTMDKSQRAAILQWMFLLLNPRPVDFADRPAAEQRALEQDAVAAGERFRDQKGRPRVGGRELAADFAAIDAVDASFLRQPVQEALERFFCAKIIGQKFLIASGGGELPLVEGLHRLCLYAPMVFWTAKAFAADRAAAAVEDRDVRRAIRALDQTLGLQDMGAIEGKAGEALRFVAYETELVEAAMNDFLGGPPPAGD